MGELNAHSPAFMLQAKFDDPQFWLRQGCYLCGNRNHRPFGLVIELSAPVYDLVETERRSVSVATVVFGLVFGFLGALAVEALNDATQKRKKVLRSEGRFLELVIHACEQCIHAPGFRETTSQSLRTEALFLEMREDFPTAKVTRFVL